MQIIPAPIQIPGRFSALGQALMPIATQVGSFEAQRPARLKQQLDDLLAQYSEGDDTVRQQLDPKVAALAQETGQNPEALKSSAIIKDSKGKFLFLAEAASKTSDPAALNVLLPELNKYAKVLGFDENIGAAFVKDVTSTPQQIAMEKIEWSKLAAQKAEADADRVLRATIASDELDERRKGREQAKEISAEELAQRKFEFGQKIDIDTKVFGLKEREYTLAERGQALEEKKHVSYVKFQEQENARNNKIMALREKQMNLDAAKDAAVIRKIDAEVESLLYAQEVAKEEATSYSPQEKDNIIKSMLDSTAIKDPLGNVIGNTQTYYSVLSKVNHLMQLDKDDKSGASVYLRTEGYGGKAMHEEYVKNEIDEMVKRKTPLHVLISSLERSDVKEALKARMLNANYIKNLLLDYAIQTTPAFLEGK